MPEYSTSLSDALLAISAFCVARQLQAVMLWPTVGFILIGLAATIGCIRFAGLTYPAQLVSWHKYLSWVSNAFGVPAIVVGYCKLARLNSIANAVLCMAMAVLVMEKYVKDKKFIDRATLGVSGIATLLCLIVCLFVRFSLGGLIGMSLYVYAGLVVKTIGYYGAIPRVDVFHYLLAVGNVAFLYGFQ